MNLCFILAAELAHRRQAVLTPLVYRLGYIINSPWSKFSAVTTLKDLCSALSHTVQRINSANGFSRKKQRDTIMHYTKYTCI